MTEYDKFAKIINKKVETGVIMLRGLQDFLKGNWPSWEADEGEVEFSTTDKYIDFHLPEPSGEIVGFRVYTDPELIKNMSIGLRNEEDGRYQDCYVFSEIHKNTSLFAKRGIKKEPSIVIDFYKSKKPFFNKVRTSDYWRGFPEEVNGESVIRALITGGFLIMQGFVKPIEWEYSEAHGPRFYFMKSNDAGIKTAYACANLFHNTVKTSIEQIESFFGEDADDPMERLRKEFEEWFKREREGVKK